MLQKRRVLKLNAFTALILSLLSFQATALCTRVARPNPLAPAATGAATGFSFDYDCQGDLSGGLFFRDGAGALLQNSTINIHGLTQNITPASGRSGVLALNFASAFFGIDGLDVTITGSSSGNSIATTGNFAHGIRVAGNGNGFVNPNDLLVVNVTNGGQASGIRLRTFSTAATPMTISTNGHAAHGIIAQSIGGSGAPGSGDFFTGGDPGLDAGPGGNVLVENNATVITSGNQSVGIFVESQGGNGGSGGNGSPFSGPGGGGNGGFSRAAEGINNGSIFTFGHDSHGLLVRSAGGRGGAGGDGSFFTSGASGGGVSSSGTATARNNGFIRTQGWYAHGILAQSLGAFGGNGGDATGFVGFAGGGARAGNGDKVVVSTSANSSITTTGHYSHGIMAQSIGGGGGSGGSGTGLIAVGGGGGSGGFGGVVEVFSSGNIDTSGVVSSGIFAQSIGGGGGNGGDSAGLGSIGGSGSSTSNSSAVSVVNDGDIITRNRDSYGIFAQSIGGGGGNGGRAASPLFSIGGSGGAGGNSGGVFITNNGNITTLGSEDSSGILAQSIGGGGGNGGNAVTASAASFGLGGSGGSGGDGETVRITNNFLFAPNSHTISTSGIRSHGIHAQSIGGGGGNGGSAMTFSAGPGASFAMSFGGSGGTGGRARNVRAESSGAIQTFGSNSSAILAQSIGGGGGNGGSALALGASTGYSAATSFGGSGGTGGVGGDVVLNNFGGSVFTGGFRSSALVAQSIGGGGGDGGFAVSGAASGSGSLSFGLGGSGGSGGSAGNVSVFNNGNVTTNHHESNVILAQSIGGGGGNGGFSVSAGLSGGTSLSASIGGSGGGGGTSGFVSVTNDGTLNSSGEYSNAVLAQSIGGGGGNGGFSVNAAAGTGVSVGASVGGSGGSGGNAGGVSVGNSGNITTRNRFSRALVAQSIGGGGGNGGFSGNFTGSTSFSGGFSLGGSGSVGGFGQNVSINNSGNLTTGFGNGSISNNSTAILAQSIGGGGGNGGFSASGNMTSGSGGTFSIGGSGASGGGAGTVGVSNTGDIETFGSQSFGILAQSIGGGGGNGGFSVSSSATTNFSGALSLGGSSSVGGNAGAVTVNNGTATDAGNIMTHNDRSTGILAQSVGGGGGNGGFSVGAGLSTGNNLGISLGGSGSGGGSGGNAIITSFGDVTTLGEFSHGLHAQTIAGGGGNGGFSVGFAGGTGHSGSLSLGGRGGNGANTSAISSISSTGNISTAGNNAIGILSQNIGGGGGNGGFSLAGSLASNNALSASLGGNGGFGNRAGSSTIIHNGDIVTLGENAYGILAQSVGGGGGNGGFSFAGSASNNRNAIGFALGGAGTNGGAGGFVSIDLTGSITTLGNSSSAIIAQSIGGGGGNAGFSAPLTITGGNGKNIGLTLGSNGGSGASAGQVTVNTQANSQIMTFGIGSHGVLAQSIGGGGGNAGHNYVTAISRGNSGVTGSLVLGSSGGVGGNADFVTVNNLADIFTIAEFSHGILAQSIGGGGGNGGNTFNGVLAPKNKSNRYSVGLGSNGGSGGYSENVIVTNTGNIGTAANNSIGIFAQSIGGGGGNGGSTINGSLASSDSSNYSLSLGTSNGGNGNRSDIVSILHSGSIFTQGQNSYGVLAQSIGGGGGNGGLSGAIALGSGGHDSGYSENLGGNGGVGATSGDVTVTLDGSVITEGIGAHAVFAQSIAGGGGNAGSAFVATRESSPTHATSTISNLVSIGGAGGSGNHAGNVSIVNNDSIQTSGDGAFGIFAQAIGGGGGNGGNVNSFSILSTEEEESNQTLQNRIRDLRVGGSSTGAGGSSGDGGEVTITNNGTILTMGTDAHAIVAQSIGGGGGLAGGASHSMPTATSLIDNPSFSGVANLTQTDTLTVDLGGQGGSNGNGKAIRINNTSNIQTNGDGSFGILAQSIGGGGGLAALGESGNSGSVAVGGGAGSNGNGGEITVTHTGDILTQGISSHAIFVQSIGGGGGLAGNIDNGITENGNTGLSLNRNNGGSGNGGNINITTSGNITTRGTGAFGIFAQSIGGGGGVAGEAIQTGTGFAGSTGAVGQGGDIVINHTGDITTFGDQAHGIFAQSLDGNGTPSGSVNITYDGSITTNGNNADAIVAIAKEGCTSDCDLSITITQDNVITGSTSGAGVRFSNGRNNVLNNNATIQSLAGLSGNALLGSGGNDVVNNNKILFGNIDLGTGNNTINNATDAAIVSHNVINLGGTNASQTLTNHGIVSPGDAGIVQTTNLTGNFVQSNSGRLILDFDSITYATDTINIQGSATVAGTVVVSPSNAGELVSGSRIIPLLSTQNGVTNQGTTLEFPESSVFKVELITINGNLALSTDVNFSPDPSVSNGNQQSLGGYFNRIFADSGSGSGGGAGGFGILSTGANSNNGEFATFVENLVAISDEKELANVIDQLTPEPQVSAMRGTVIGSSVFNQRLRSCHQRSGANKFIREGECTWHAFGYRRVDRDQTANAQGYESRIFSFATGVQYEISNGFHLGGGITFETGDVDSRGTNANQKSNGLQVGLIAKKEFGATFLTSTLAGGMNFNDAFRQVTDGTNTFLAESDFRNSFISLESDLSHTFDFDSFFIRPIGGVNFLGTFSSSFQETGAGILNVIGNSASDFSVNTRVGADLGYEFKLGNKCGGDDCYLFRPYVRLGHVFYLTDENTEVEARFQGAPSSQTFIISSPVFEDFVDLSAGFEVLSTESAVLRAEYNVQKGDEFTQQSGLLKVSLPF